MTIRVLLVALCLSGLLAGLVAAGDLEVAASPEAVPAEVKPELREALMETGFAVSLDGSRELEIWFPQSAPSGGAGEGALGVNFGQFPVGALLGLVRLDATWYDYKNLPVPPGLYVLRYGQQPADGNHTGITFYRDYAMLVPLERDAGPGAAYTQSDLNSLSKEATRTVHPGVMALFPVWDPVEGVQIVPNELDQPTLVWHFEDLAVGYVLQGHGELEGY